MTRAPPSYEDATSPSINVYLASRTPPLIAPPISEPLTYTLDCSQNPVPFPQPENAWLARDIDHQDWSSFLAQLLSDSKDSGTQSPQYSTFVLTEWNEKFFGPRGCRVDITTMPQQAQQSNGSAPAAVQEEPKFGGLGFRVGNGFVGMSTGKNLTGVGIKLPGMLLGVATSSGNEAGK